MTTPDNSSNPTPVPPASSGPNAPFGSEAQFNAPAPAGPGAPSGSGVPSGSGAPSGLPGSSGSGGQSVPPGPAGAVPSLPAQNPAGAAVPSEVVGTFADYAAAQQAVDLLSDQKFPVQRTAIIGTDLRLVENVLGRLTTGRAALAGAASGAWFGLFIGLIFGLFSDSGWFGVILFCLLIGAAWGAIFGAIAHAATGGRRDFASRSSIQAGQYAVMTDPDLADQARQILIQLNWRASGAQ